MIGEVAKRDHTSRYVVRPCAVCDEGRCDYGGCPACEGTGATVERIDGWDVPRAAMLGERLYERKRDAELARR